MNGLDIGTTALGLAGIEIPSYTEGQDFLATDYTPREFAISTRDRCDFSIDRIRSVRSKEYKYIRNFMTDRPYIQPSYMDADGVEFVQVMKQLHAEKKLDAIQDRFLSDYRPSEELYDLKEDPFELNNLALNPDYSEDLSHYAQILNNWIFETDDKGQYPECEGALKLMLGIWGKYAINLEYIQLRKKYKDLARSLYDFKNAGWKKVNVTVE